MDCPTAKQAHSCPKTSGQELIGEVLTMRVWMQYCLPRRYFLEGQIATICCPKNVKKHAWFSITLLRQMDIPLDFLHPCSD